MEKLNSLCGFYSPDIHSAPEGTVFLPFFFTQNECFLMKMTFHAMVKANFLHPERF